jgi:hypothetical protein
VAEIGIERGNEFILAHQNGLLQFGKVTPTLFQRWGTIAQKSGALKGKCGVQISISFFHGVHWKILSHL